MDKNKTISIIIPVYNAEKYIDKLIREALNQKADEVIIVDDGSTDNTAEIVKKYPVKYVYQKNSGPASARNRGFKESHGDIVVFTDSDCIPQKDWISRLLEGFTTDDVAAVAGSYNITNPGSLLASCIHEEIKLRHLRLKKIEYIKFFGSYNVAIKRHIFEEVRGFNEDYKAASVEDNDLSYKILNSGFRIKFQDSALVAHHHTERLWKYFREQYRHGYWRMKVYKDFPSMTKGDDYTQLKDAVEIPVAFMTFCTTIFFWHKYGLTAFLLLAASNFIIQAPTAIKLINLKKNIKFIYLAWVTFLRSYARAFGVIRGIWKFWL